MGTDLMLGQKDHQDPMKAYGMSVGEDLHALQTETVLPTTLSQITFR